MYKKRISIVITAVLFLLLLCCPKSVMAKDNQNYLEEKEELFNITLSDAGWSEEDGTYAQSGSWKQIEGSESYVIESQIGQQSEMLFDDSGTKLVDATVIYGDAAKDLYERTGSTMDKVKQTLYSNYFTDYLMDSNSIVVEDCSNKGYSQLFHGKYVYDEDGYFETTEVFYGMAKGYLISFAYKAIIETGDQPSEDWFDNLFYDWLDKIPGQGLGGNLSSFISSYFWVGAIIAIVVMISTAIVVVCIIRKDKKKKMGNNNVTLTVNEATLNTGEITNNFKFCTRCGYKTESNSKFCGKCGSEFQE